ncbi:hypothetical protein AB84_4322 [Escherichia coli 2-052-05_S3_C1]|nr:hypothetical protein AB84_4322 [Escherichia coli 2-052-05_S3_C1]KDU00249.1 hypothetical protein AB46_4293 [Escherichia coli 3-267-03_S1_C2]KDV78298.1 hypothetical protein AC42_4414 [Escherichia coli 2-052-05_S3_C3]KEN71625.1 hypothetical protein AC14_4481 [Escherichia coli 2-052-05_S3_C2]
MLVSQRYEFIGYLYRAVHNHPPHYTECANSIITVIST